MIARFSAFLITLTPRERWLIALVPLVVLPVAFVFLVVLPLMDQRRAAQGALADAQAVRDWYQARQTDIAALPVADAEQLAPTRVDPIGLGGIEDSLIDAGLRDRVTLLTNAQGAEVALTLQDARFESLMDWVDEITTTGGYGVAALQLTGTDDGGQVDAQIRLAPDG